MRPMLSRVAAAGTKVGHRQGRRHFSYFRNDNDPTFSPVRGSAFHSVGSLRRRLTCPHPSDADRVKARSAGRSQSRTSSGTGNGVAPHCVPALGRFPSVFAGHGVMNGAPNVGRKAAPNEDPCITEAVLHSMVRGPASVSKRARTAQE